MPKGEGDTMDTSGATTSTGTKRKQKTADIPLKNKSARFNTFVTGKDGQPNTNVTLIPTSNAFDGLKDDAEEKEVIIKKSKSKEPKVPKIYIPPITIFNQTRSQVEEFLNAQGVTQYSLKILRHGIQLYCSVVDDFKKVRAEISKHSMDNYSHDLKEERLFKVALKGLHLMETKDLQSELVAVGLAPVNIRAIVPKNPRYANDVVYVVDFKAGTIKFNELLKKRVVYHTVVQWEPYRRKEGVVQCTRCQRPGHGARNCNMPPRCCLCGENHETLKCPTKENCLTTVMDTDENQANPDPNKGKSVEVSIPARCCNCNANGHFASDPKCPKKIAYIQSRRLRASEGRADKKKSNHVIPTPRYSPGGPTFANILKPGSSNFGPSGTHFGPSGTNFGPSGTHYVNTKSSPYGKTFHFGGQGPSGNCEESPFSVEELTAMTFDIIDSLKNVRHLPRSEAFMAVMNVAFKYLYRDD